MPDQQRELVPPSRRPLKARPLYGGALLIAMVGLRCVAGLFLLGAVYGFVRGFWRLLMFFAGIVSLGTAVIGSDFGARLGAATGAALVPLLFGTIGSVCLVAAKRIHARLAPRPDEPSAPVIYLRSFTADSDLSRRPRVPGRLFPWRTEEEQLVEALREMGRVIAIGRPGERLPQLGATRVYVEGEDWQQQVRSWFNRAALVVIHVPPHPTHGVTWEVERGLTSVPRARLVFLLPRDPASAEWITWKLREYGVTASLPDPLPRGPYRSGCSGFLYFSDHSHAEFSALVKPPFLRRPFSKVLVPAYRLALQPIITRVVGCWTPLALALGDASLVAAGVTFSALVIAFGLSDHHDERAIAYCRGPYCIYADRAVEILRANGRRARAWPRDSPEWRSAGFPVSQGRQPGTRSGSRSMEPQQRQPAEEGSRMAITCPVDLDTRKLREEIRTIHARVASDPSSEFCPGRACRVRQRRLHHQQRRAQSRD